MYPTPKTTKELVLLSIQVANERGCTVPEFLEESSHLKPQTVYPCFTQLYKAKKILDSRQRRKSKAGRNSIVWVDAQYGGTIPVWGSGQPSYSYRNRAKIVMDVLDKFGHLSVSEMMTCSPDLKPMSTSSLVSRLVRQQWVRKTNRTRLNQEGQTCRLYALTPRGQQVRTSAPNRKERTYEVPPLRLLNTEKTHVS